MTKPKLRVAGVHNYNIKKGEVKEGNILTAVKSPYIDDINPINNDEEAVKLYKGNLLVGYMPKESQWRKHSDILTFEVVKILYHKVNDKGEIFIKSIQLEITGANVISDMVQDTGDTFPYRVYWKNGKPYVSATSVLGVKILDDTTKKWMTNHRDYTHYEAVMEFYSNRGTYVHEALEQYAKDGVILTPEHFQLIDEREQAKIDTYNNKREMSINTFGYSKMPKKEYISLNKDKPDDEEPSDAMYKLYMGGINFLQAGVEIISAEEMVISDELGIAGSCDLLARIDGKLIAIDYKTSANVKNPAYFSQASFYASAVQHRYNEKVYAGILKLNTTTKKGYQLVIVDEQEYHLNMMKLYKSVFEHQHMKLKDKKLKDLG